MLVDIALDLTSGRPILQYELTDANVAGLIRPSCQGGARAGREEERCAVKRLVGLVEIPAKAWNTLGYAGGDVEDHVDRRWSLRFMAVTGRE